MRVILLGEALRIPFDPALPFHRWGAFADLVTVTIILTLAAHIGLTTLLRWLSPQGTRPGQVISVIPRILPFSGAVIATGICYWGFRHVYDDSSVSPIPFMARIAVCAIVWIGGSDVLLALLLHKRTHSRLRRTVDATPTSEAVVVTDDWRAKIALGGRSSEHPSLPPADQNMPPVR